MIPVAPSLAPWLDGTAHEKTGLYVTYRGKGIASILAAFRQTRALAKLDQRATPYSIRHTMAREMRKARVPSKQISLFLGHLPQGAAETTAVYAPYEPDYISAATPAIETVMQRLGQLTTTPLVAKPTDVVGDGHLVAAPTGKAVRRGIGEAKRADVRRLILEGVQHAQIREQASVSDGTICAIRKTLRAGAPILRTSR